jgi:hypothetical protein
MCHTKRLRIGNVTKKGGAEIARKLPTFLANGKHRPAVLTNNRQEYVDLIVQADK